MKGRPDHDLAGPRRPRATPAAVSRSTGSDRDSREPGETLVFTTRKVHPQRVIVTGIPMP